MISYIRHNSVFDLGTRTGVSSCEGLYAELDDIYSKFINPQVRVQYETNASTIDCLCNMSGKQTLSGNIHAFIFQNGLISVTVDEDDNVTVAEVGSGGGGGGVTAFNLAEHAVVVPEINFDSTRYPVYVSAYDEIDLFGAQLLIATGTVDFPFIIYTDGYQTVPTTINDDIIECSRASGAYTKAGYYMVGGTIMVYFVGETPVFGLVSDDAEIIYNENIG